MNTINANISCYDDYSCNDLVINTDNSRNIFINLNMYLYSNDIEINHDYYTNVNVKCGSDNDHRYIEYNVRGNDISDAF